VGLLLEEEAEDADEPAMGRVGIPNFNGDEKDLRAGKRGGGHF
jgi:hypothetical protein